MSRKDYINLAGALLSAQRAIEDVPLAAQSIEAMSNALRGLEFGRYYIAEMLERDNPRFNKQHFVAVSEGKIDLFSRPKRKAA